MTKWKYTSAFQESRILRDRNANISHQIVLCLVVNVYCTTPPENAATANTFAMLAIQHQPALADWHMEIHGSRKCSKRQMKISIAFS